LVEHVENRLNGRVGFCSTCDVFIADVLVMINNRRCVKKEIKTILAYSTAPFSRCFSAYQRPVATVSRQGFSSPKIDWYDQSITHETNPRGGAPPILLAGMLNMLVCCARTSQAIARYAACSSEPASKLVLQMAPCIVRAKVMMANFP
jgi:hypothetical protein